MKKLFLQKLFSLVYHLKMSHKKWKLISYFHLILFTYCIETPRLFLNIKNENFWQKLDSNFLPQPPSEGGTKKMIFLEILRKA